MQRIKNLKKEVKMLFIDHFNRPKKKPMHESVVQIALEDRYDHKKTSYALRVLEKEGVLFSIKVKLENVGEVRFFVTKKIHSLKREDEIRRKISKYSYWIQRYSNYRITKMLGDHLHALVKGEVRAQGFVILSEFSNEYDGKKWPGRETLDMIAEHKKNQLVVGVEVKNMLSLAPYSEVSKKIKMCNFFGIKPVFACRWIEPYRKKITENGGFVWQFKNQLYPIGQEKFVKELGKRFSFPIEVKSELPEKSVLEFQEWVRTVEGKEYL